MEAEPQTYVVTAKRRPLGTFAADDVPVSSVEATRQSDWPAGCVEIAPDRVHVTVQAGSALEAVRVASQHHEVGGTTRGHLRPAAPGPTADAREALGLIAEIARDLAYLQQRLADLQQEVAALIGESGRPYPSPGSLTS